MTILFTCPEAPNKLVPCVDKPDCEITGIPCDPVVREDCYGFRKESEAPECCFSNDNAYPLMDLLGIRSESEIQAAQLPKLQRSLLRAINLYSSRQHLVREPVITKEFVDGGNKDEHTLERLLQLRELVTYAQRHGFKIVMR